MTKVSRKGFVDKNGQKVVIVPKIPGATAGNLASLDADGNLQDSGKKPADFALSDHFHEGIRNRDHKVEINDDGEVLMDGGYYTVFLDDGTHYDELTVTHSNFTNLKRALATPSSTPEDDATKLITSKAVFDAIALKQNAEAYGVSLTKESDYYIWGEMDDSEPEQIYGEIKALLPTSDSVAPCILRIDDNGHEVRVIGVINWTAVASADAENTTVHIYVGNKSFDCVITKDTRTPQEEYSSDGHFIKNDYGQDI